MHRDCLTPARHIVLVLALLLLVPTACRRTSSLGDFQPALDGAAQMTRSFWTEIVSGDFESASARLADEEEIAAALEAWATAMNEPLDEEAIATEAGQTRTRLLESFEAYRTGEAQIPRDLTEEALRDTDIMVTNKMLLSPRVGFIQRLTLTAEGVDPVEARVAGAVKVDRGPWKSLWLP